MKNKNSTVNNNLILFEKILAQKSLNAKQSLVSFKDNFIAVILALDDAIVVIDDKFFLLKKNTVNVFVCKNLRLFNFNANENVSFFAVKNNGIVPTCYNFTKTLDGKLKNSLFSLLGEESKEKFAVDFYKFLVENGKSENTASSPEFISKLIKYLTENYSFPITVSNCAKAVSVTPNYLENAFKKYVGVPIAKFLAEIRLSASEKLLTTTSLSLNEISKSVGLNDAQVLIRLYKKYYGVTPYKYKLLRKNENGKN